MRNVNGEKKSGRKKRAEKENGKIKITKREQRYKK